MLGPLKTLYSPAAGSTRGFLNLDELWRVAGMALLHGLIAAAVLVITAVQADLANIVTIPGLGGLITMILTAVLAALDKLKDGEPPSNV